MRHLLKPIQAQIEISMVVITGIITAIKIGLRVGKVGYKFGSKTRTGMRFLKEHPKLARYGTIVASSAPLIYDLLNIDYSGIQKIFQQKPRQGRQTRNNMVVPRTRQRFDKDCYPRKRRSSRRQRY